MMTSIAKLQKVTNILLI